MSAALALVPSSAASARPSASPCPPLHMVQLRFDTNTLQRSQRRQRLPPDLEDLGYLLHGQLAALFGDLAPKPFFARPVAGARSGCRGVEVFGYGPAGGEALCHSAALFAEPADVVALDTLAVKALPRAWSPGLRLGFEVRVCPVVRLASASSLGSAGAEVDVFVAARAKAEEADPNGPLPGRAESYARWLEHALGKAATLDACTVKHHRQVRLFRRTQGQRRRPRVLERPEAMLAGSLTVRDGAAFGHVLARGIGRHRAFGFGMLLLRPSVSNRFS